MLVGIFGREAQHEFAANNFSKASELFERVMRLPNIDGNAVARTGAHLCTCYVKLGRIDEAVEVTARSLEAQPDDAVVEAFALSSAAEFAEWRGDSTDDLSEKARFYEEAMDHYRTADSLFPDPASKTGFARAASKRSEDFEWVDSPLGQVTIARQGDSLVFAGGRLCGAGYALKLNPDAEIPGL